MDGGYVGDLYETAFSSNILTFCKYKNLSHRDHRKMKVTSAWYGKLFFCGRITLALVLILFWKKKNSKYIFIFIYLNTEMARAFQVFSSGLKCLLCRL